MVAGGGSAEELVRRAWKMRGEQAKGGRAGVMQGTEARTRSLNEMQQRKGELVNGCKRLG